MLARSTSRAFIGDCLSEVATVVVAALRARAARLLLILLAATGCSGREAVDPVDVDSGDASARAIEAYDTSEDGALNDAELAQAPALLKYKSLYDADNNGTIEEAEIAQRLDLWQEQGLGFRQLSAVVTLDGRPLVGAHVEFEPEQYVTPAVKPARGETGPDGVASISVADADLPPALANLPIEGVTGGTFKVRVTHPTNAIPDRYNAKTELGEEIASDTIRERATIELSSRPNNAKPSAQAEAANR
jgi:hypothetical protein